MLKSMRNRFSQSVASRPGSREDSLDGTLDSCDTDGDPFDGGFEQQRSQQPLSRSSTTDRRKLRRLHSASSAATSIDRIEPLATLPVTVAELEERLQPQQRQSLKQRAKNFLFRRRSFSSLESAGQHRVDGRHEVFIDPQLVRGYAAAKRHHSDDCVLDAGLSPTPSRDKDRDRERDKDKDKDKNKDKDPGGKKAVKQNKISRSLNFFAASMRRGRSSSREPPASPATAGNRASVGGSSSEGGWTDGGGGGSTLGRRGHRNSSEQYMMAPSTPQPQSPHPMQQTQQQQQHPLVVAASSSRHQKLNSQEALAINLNEIAGLCLERTAHRGLQPSELFANWPAVPLEGASGWLESTAWGRGGGKRSSSGKRHSMALTASGSPGYPYGTGSLTRGGGGSSLVGNSSLEAASLISSSTAEQLNLLCKQFNHAVTLRKSYRGKDGLTAAGKLQRRSSGNWSGSSGSSGRTAESKSFTKQLSNSTSASKDSAVELKFEDDQKRQGQHQLQQQHQQQQQQHLQHQAVLYAEQQARRRHQEQLQRQQQHLEQQQQQEHQQQQRPHVPPPAPHHQWAAGSYPIPHHYYTPAAQSSSQHHHQYHHPPMGRPPSPMMQASSSLILQDDQSGPAPAPPRRSTSLQRRSASSGVPESPTTSANSASWSSASPPPTATSNGPVSPTYLNHLLLTGSSVASSTSPIETPPPSLTSTPSPPQTTTMIPAFNSVTSPSPTKHMASSSAGAVSASAAYRLGLITESPDDDESAAASSGAPVPPPRTAAYRTQRSLPDEMGSTAAYRQWQGALPYPAVQLLQQQQASTPPPPPRPRQPLLPTPPAIATGGDSGARIVRQARAKLSQLNRLSAELAKKQLRPSQPPPQCPFDALEQPLPQQQPQQDPHYQHQQDPHYQHQQDPHYQLIHSPSSPSVRDGNVNRRASLWLHDETAVRDFLKSLTAVCAASDY